MCSEQYHENQPLEFYCGECKVPICHKCTVVSHNRHTMTDTRKAAQQLNKVKAEAVVYQNEMRKQTELMEKNRNEILCAEKKMTQAVEELIRNLREHERTMKAKFAEIYQAQQKHHATRLENFELVLTQLNSCVERGESILERNISAEILQTNQAIVERCKELLKTKKPEIYKPPHVHYMVEKKVDFVDRIVISVTDPSLSVAEGQCQKEVREKRQTNFTIVTRDSDGLQCYHKDDQINVTISTPTGNPLKTELGDTKDGNYTVTYKPHCAGQHRVEIQVNGQPLTGSPWVVQVVPHQYQFEFKFGSTGKEQGDFDTPYDITVSGKTGTIAVADFENKRIQMFSSDGNFLREIALKREPSTLAFVESGDLLVCILNDENQLSLFTEDGQFIKHINDGHLNEPIHISLESDGRIIICDMGDNNIKVLTLDGKNLLQSFSAPGCDEHPCCVVHHENKFFVSYEDAHCVKVFNNAGVYLYDIGCQGSRNGQFNGPVGLVIDEFNHLIVCDGGNSRLQLFTLDGKFVTEIAESFFKDSIPLRCAI